MIVFVLQGATIVDQVVTITPVANYVPAAERVISFQLSYSLFWSCNQNLYSLLQFMQEASISDNAVCQVPGGVVSPDAEVAKSTIKFVADFA